MKDRRIQWHPMAMAAALCLLGLAGCGGTKSPANTTQYYGDYHPAGWMDVHGGQAVAGMAACTKCHELSILRVGSGIPTCMTTGCHHQSTPGFADPGVHGLRAKAGTGGASGTGLTACQICHGLDFTGGPAANACVTCHGVAAPHPPKPWRLGSGSTFTHVTADPSNAAVCAQCHFPGSAKNPVGHPAIPAPAGTQPGCFNATLCHDDKVAPHPIPFLAGMVDSSQNGHMTVTAAAFAADCATCHAYSGTSPTTTAPLCQECHQLADPTLPGTNAGTCRSCHTGTAGLPKGPGGTGYPSIAGAHAKHMNLATPLTCNTCHAGSGSGTFEHYDNANARLWELAGPAVVSIDTTFQAKTGGTPAFSDADLTCSNVSCHGGRATPDWTVGTLNSATQCTACHGVAGSAASAVQFNDAFGRHALGTHDATNALNAIACTTCHTMTNGSPGAQAHFKYLNTPAVDGLGAGGPADQLPSGTIAFNPAIVTGPGTYTVTSATQGNGGCALTCHTHVHTAAVNDWTSTGVPHPIPFLAGQTDNQGNSHLTLTAAKFSADCASCHAYAGTSPVAAAPLCSKCHTLADPTVLATGAGTCLSCHAGASGLPKGPTGTAFPSLAGAHAKHMNLATVLTCDACHTGNGAGTAAHYANANTRTGVPAAPGAVAMAAAFNARSGAATFTPASLTCSNVSCHGGQATPSWTTGTLNSLTQCTACHGVAATAAGAPQFNDAFGRHALGTHNATNAANAIACTTCHNMGNGSAGALAHFKYLNTAAVDGTATGSPADQLPSGTIAFNPAIVTGPGTYTVTSATQGNGGCALTCHTHIHVPTIDTWTASGSPHPIPFLTGQSTTQGNGHLNATAATFTADCSACHAYSGTAPMATAPLCNVCHKLANPTVLATGAGTCLSCHAGTSGLPLGPGGTAFPSIAGAHAKHLSLGTATNCNTCHAGSGSGTPAHYTNADARHGTPVAPASVALDATFNAKTGAAAFAPASLTCSNVSCHGGQATPSWTTGTINSLIQCTVCHKVASTAATATQFNDAFGRHSLGTHNATNAANAIACTTCHNMGNGSAGALAHFKYLNTQAVDGTATGLPADQLPSGTIAFSPAIVTGAGTYTVTSSTQGNGGCALTCHTHIHVGTVNTWTAAGPPHPVPFLSGQATTQGNGHLNATAATFTSDCSACHAYSGASPMATAPLCNVCHKLANPTVLATGAGTCLSCHSGASGLPKGPGGTTFPSIAGAHAKHMNLPTTLTCDTCHAGSSTGTAAHYTNADARHGTPAAPGAVAIDATFNGKGGVSTFTPASLTCSNVSCHGGQATPSWTTGTINSLTQCTACHGVAATAATAVQYNDAFGRHSQGTHNALNAANAIACTTCHNMGNGSAGALAHFKYLNTTAVDAVATGTPADQLPSGTIAFNPAIVTGAGTYTVTSATQGNGGCALTCHTHIHVATIDTWTASGSPHPVPFLTGMTTTQGNGHLNATAATFTADCSACHAYSGTAPMATAPLCNVCHKLANPTVLTTGAGTCLSCHSGASGLPKGPGGTTFPSIAGAHAKHMNLPTTLTCDTCHAGSSTGTAAHYTNADARHGTPAAPGAVAIDATFNGKGGVSTFTPASLTCSNVSCHGGQATPSWTTGTINSLTQCTACHGVAATAATAVQYNDAFGRHSQGTHNALNAANAIACTTCHNMGNGSAGALAHFKYLNTTAVDAVATGTPADQLPSGTIAFNPAIVTGAGTYTVTSSTQGNGGCALTCHTHVHTAAVNSWTSTGVPHPVPFLTGQVDNQGNGHLNLTAAQFTADCALCHAHTGTSPLAGAPLCSACHTLANPTVLATGAGTCLSCHSGPSGLPKGPTGTAFPSIAGAHAKHMNLATALTCDACHLGSGAGTATHYANANTRIGTPASPASVSVDFQFKAKSGNPSFTPATLTCSNVSCHGGQTTPGWQVGTLNSATQCTACHGVAGSAATTAQYNDAFGRHSLGTHDATNAANAIACTTCHNMANGSAGALAHFKYLNTAAVDGVATGTPADQLPSGTIAFNPAIVSGPGTYTVTSATQGNGGCALTCHTHIHAATVNTWTASGATHPIPFYAGQTDNQGNAHLTVTAAIFTTTCATCHATSGTSPLATAPACSVCHALADPTQVATGMGTCLSCHVGAPGLPAGPTGVSFPSIEGAHAEHMALPTPLTCNTCHANAGTGTTTHYDNANARVAPPVGPSTVSIDATYNAQSGNVASFNASALTCSSTSCHGGLETPDWRSGSLVSTTQCTACHAINYGTTPSQFNDAIGRHAWGTHSTAGTLDCRICHDMTQATAGALNHFAELNTPAVSSTNKRPSTTLKFNLGNATYPITGAATYTISAATPEGDGGCALTCHSMTHTDANNHWAMPKGSGVAHPVPFYFSDVSTGGNQHQTTTLAVFNGECIGCHDLGGASTKAGPTCNVCHTLADPTAVATGAGTCLSCHVGANFKTMGPTGTAWPNLQGAHPTHLSLLTFTRATPALPASMSASVCEACHVGSVPGDAANTHYSNANKRLTGHPVAGPASVSIDPAFNARSGTAGTTASATAFTCSNVSCHGGQVTPGWQSGSLTVNATTYCIACHKITSTATQYNDATGRHNSPNDHNQTCNYCHDMTQAKQGAINHFKYLDTSAVRLSPDQLSSDTIKFGGGSQPATGALTYTVNATIGRGGCALSCHGKTHTTTGNTWN
ncbi:MAG: CxxxxCH/CxxCH domain-containing protein [Holophagaceae bacterium]